MGKQGVKLTPVDAVQDVYHFLYSRRATIGGQINLKHVCLSTLRAVQGDQSTRV